jgi:2'-5' RNA ligase
VHEQVLLGAEELGMDTQAERERAFRPHVSVARPRRAGAIPRAFYELVLAEAWSPDAVHLVESVAGEGPRRYVSRRAFPLAP